MASSVVFDEKERKELSDFVADLVFDTKQDTTYDDFMAYKQESYRDWYTGTSRFDLKYLAGNQFLEEYQLETTNLTGTFSTPHFGKPFDANTFPAKYRSILYIYLLDDVSYEGNITIDIEHNIDNYPYDEDNVIEIQKQKQVGGEWIEMEMTNWISFEETKAHIEFPLYDVEPNELESNPQFDFEFIRIRFSRASTSKSPKSTTGMSVSWHYTPHPDTHPDDRFVEANQYFIQLANAIHENPESAKDMKDLITDKRRETKNDCDSHGILNSILEKYNSSTEPIHTEEITDESLELAATTIYRQCTKIRFKKIFILSCF